MVNITDVTAEDDATIKVGVTSNTLEQQAFKALVQQKANFDDLLEEFAIEVDAGEELAKSVYYELSKTAWIIKSVGKATYVSAPAAYMKLKGNAFWALFKTLVTANGFELVAADPASYEGISGIKSIDMRDVKDFVAFLSKGSMSTRKVAKKLITSVAHKSWIAQAKGLHQSAISCLLGKDRSLSTILNLNSGSKGSQLVATCNRLYNLLKEKKFDLTEESFLPASQYASKIAKPAYENRGIFTEAEITYFSNTIAKDRTLPEGFAYLSLTPENAKELRDQFQAHKKDVDSVIAMRQPVLFGDEFSKKKRMTLNDKVQHISVEKVLTVFKPTYLGVIQSKGLLEMKAEITEDFILRQDEAIQPILNDYKSFLDALDA